MPTLRFLWATAFGIATLISAPPLAAQDSNGGTGDSGTPHGPTAHAGGPYVAAAGEDVVFDATGSFDVDAPQGDSILSHAWEIDLEEPFDFDDGVQGINARLPGGFGAAGFRRVALRVTDNTAAVFPDSGSPNLTDDDEAAVVVYQKVITDLAARPKDTKIQLTWSPGGATYFEIHRSERGPNHGFQKIATTQSTYSTYLDQDLRPNTRYYYRILSYPPAGGGDPLGSSCAVVAVSGRRPTGQNSPPEFLTTPATFALEDAPYYYDADAADPDGDALVFTLNLNPDGMTIDPVTGQIRWTPRASDVGATTVEVQVSDGRGGVQLQTYTLLVRAVNDPPRIVSVPPTDAEVGFPYLYDVEAMDEENEPLTFALDSPPSGMVIDPGTGLIQWTPSPEEAGSNPIEVRVSDASGGSASQAFVVTVVDRPFAPVVSAIPGQTVQAPEAFTAIRLDDYVADPDHDDTRILWQVSGQTQLVVSIADRVVTLSYSPGTAVTEALTFTATDPDGLSASTTADFTVVQPVSDRIGPVAKLMVTPDTVSLGGQATVTVLAQDNLGIAQVVVTVDGTALPVEDLGGGQYQATYAATILGHHLVETQVLDEGGNVAVDAVRVLVVDPRITSSLDVALSAPVEGALLLRGTNVIGTATSENLADYRLEYSPNGSDAFIEFARGESPVTNGVLGTFDPSLLENDLYVIRLTARTLGGLVKSVSVVVEVSGELKVGLYTVSFDDKAIVVGNFPLTVTRTYDSRDKTKGDFGFGWKVGLINARLTENRSPGEFWRQTRSTDFLPIYRLVPILDHRVVIRFGDSASDRREFEAVPSPNRQTLFPIEFLDRMDYVGMPGTSGTLVPGEQPAFTAPVTQDEIFILDTSINTYNPTVFTYTERDGFQYRFSEVAPRSLRHALTQITDPNGVSLTLDRNGVLHSGGKSIGFMRDAEGRITQIQDPNGGIIRYEYDVRGDLAAVIHVEGIRTEFAYDRLHNLIEVRDPQGNQGVRNDYDAAGRWVATVDASGRRIDFTHDLDARREVTRDRLGNQTVYTYDAVGNVLSETDALGNTTTFTYDSRGNILTQTDPLGRRITRSVDADGNILAQTDVEGNLTTATYNERGQILTVNDARGRRAAYTYDGRGHLVQTDDGEGGITRDTYDNRGNLLSTTDPLGNLTRYAYDASGNMTSVTDALGQVTTLTYDANNHLSSATGMRTLPNGARQALTTRFEYDPSGNPTSLVDPLGQAFGITYNPLGRLESLTDKNGQTLRCEYGSSGRPSRIVYPDGAIEQFTYDAEGRELSATDRDGLTTRFEYDALGRRIRTIHPGGAASATEYDAVGRVVTRTDTRGNVTRYQHAPSRITIIDALGHATVEEFDHDGPPARLGGEGNRIRLTDANGQVTIFSHEQGSTAHGNARLTQITFPDDSVSTTGYDVLGREIFRTDPSGATTRFDYDALGRLTSVLDPRGTQTRFTYDEMGNQTALTDANGNVTRFEYDELGRLTRRLLPLGQSETYAYDAMGNLAAHTDFNGTTTAFRYDNNHRLLEKLRPDGATERYAYTPQGYRVQAGGDTYVYDPDGRLLTERKANGDILTYAYDAAGNRTSLSTPHGDVLYTYDALNRLESVREPDGALTQYAYDNVGNLVRTSLPDGSVTLNTYDTLGRLASIESRDAGGTLMAAYTYTRGPAGHITGVVEAPSGRAVDYAYDDAHQLLTETIRDPIQGLRTIEYAYDAVGNRISKEDSAEGLSQYVYDANNRLLTESGPAGVISYGYDANGSLTAMSGGGVNLTYGYNADGRLSAVSDGTSLVSFEYDADGLRTRAVVNGTDVTEYLVDKNLPFEQVLRETDGLGRELASYVYGHQLISMTHPGVGTRYVHHDAQPSIRYLTDAAGAISDAYGYDSFGNSLGASGAMPNPYRYAGEQYDARTGLYYLRARYFDPAIGRFTSMDPFEGTPEQPFSLHPYLYGQNDPINNRDPSGMINLPSALVAIGTRIQLAVRNLQNLRPLVETARTTLALERRGGPPAGQGRTLAGTRLIQAQAARTFAVVLSAIQVVGWRINYEKWYGNPPAQVRQLNYVLVAIRWLETLKAGINPGLQLLESATLLTCDPYTRAYTYCGFDGMFFCPRYWRRPLVIGYNTKAGVIIHELTHSVCLTRDIRYGVDACRALARTDHNRAVNNADNYKYKAEDVAAGLFGGARVP